MFPPNKTTLSDCRQITDSQRNIVFSVHNIADCQIKSELQIDENMLFWSNLNLLKILKRTFKLKAFF